MLASKHALFKYGEEKRGTGEGGAGLRLVVENENKVNQKDEVDTEDQAEFRSQEKNRKI